jgi:3-oxoacyl-[acyl-carrier protein] reductase
MSTAKPLSGKVAIITGGTKGIGRETSLRLAKDGAKVVISYSSDSAAADELVKQIGAEEAIAVKGDAGNVADIEVLVKTAVEKFGKIDIVVPNAGNLPMVELANTSEEIYDRTMNLLVKGPYFLVQVCNCLLS